jgi:zinc protease
LLAELGVARADPDFEKLRLMNEVLGGAFSSRLNLNLRERKGYTYGAHSSLSSDRSGGSITLGTDVQTQFTGAAAREILKEATAIRNERISSQELARAQQSVIQSLPARFASVRASADAIAYLYQFNLSPDYYQRLPSAIAKISVSEIQAAAQKHLWPEKMKIIAVGDRAQLDPQLAELTLGPTSYRTVDGAPVPPH